MDGFLLRSGSEMIIITQVFRVKTSIYAVKELPRITMLLEWDCCLPHARVNRQTRKEKEAYTHLALRLNCLMILLIFSNRCTSGWLMVAALAMTRNVVRSNKTTSSAPHILQKLSRLLLKASIFGIRQCMI